MLSAAAWLATSVVFLNFGGARVSPGAEDAAGNRTLILDAGDDSRDVPAFDATPYKKTYTRAAAIAQISDRVADLFAGYDVSFSTARPSQAPYTMVLIGGSSTDLHVAERSEDGVAVVDCGNALASNVVFVWADELAPSAAATKSGGVADALDEIAVVAAHELGHSFGLEHVSRESDIMFPGNVERRTGFYGASPFAAGASVCAPGASSQDSAARLSDAVGRLAQKSDQHDIGAVCATRSDCAENVCIKTRAAGGFCSAACSPAANTCPASAVCTEFSGAYYCAPTHEAAGCSQLPSRAPAAIPWILAIGFVLVGAFRRRE